MNPYALGINRPLPPPIKAARPNSPHGVTEARKAVIYPLTKPVVSNQLDYGNPMEIYVLVNPMFSPIAAPAASVNRLANTKGTLF